MPVETDGIVVPTVCKARWPFKIGDTMIEKGEQGRLATMAECQRLIPGVQKNPQSPFISVVFRGFLPIIVLRKQVEVQP